MFGGVIIEMSRLLDKYRRLSVQIRASFWYVIAQIIEKGTHIIVVPLYTRILTAAEYGEYSLFYSWKEILLIFGTLRIFGNSYNVGLAKFEKEKNRYTSATMGIGFAVTGVFFVVVLLFRTFFEHWLEMPFVWICLLLGEVFWTPAYAIWMTKERYEYHYKSVSGLSTVMSLAVPIIGISMVFILPDRAFGAVLGKALPPILAGIGCAVILLKRGRELYRWEYWRYALSFNVPLIFYYLAQVLLNHSDRIMIQHMGGKGQVAVYSVANAVANVLNVVNSAINQSYIPYMFQKMKRKEEYKIRNISSGIMAVVAAMNMCLIACAPEAMRLFAPESYHAGIWLIPPLAASVFVQFMAQMYCNVEFYYEKKYYLMWTSFFVCICNIALNYYFIGRFGYLAAGYTTLASYFLYFMGHVIVVRHILRKEHGARVFHTWNMLVVCIVFLLFSAVMEMLYGLVTVRYLILLMVVSAGIYKRRWIVRQWEIMRKG